MKETFTSWESIIPNESKTKNSYKKQLNRQEKRKTKGLQVLVKVKIIYLLLDILNHGEGLPSRPPRSFYTVVCFMMRII